MGELLDPRSRLGIIKRRIEADLKVLSLPDIGNPLITDRLSGVMNRLSLRIENAILQCDIDLC